MRLYNIMCVCMCWCTSHLWPLALQPVQHREGAPVLAVLTGIDQWAEPVVAVKAPQSLMQRLNVVRYCRRTYVYIHTYIRVRSRRYVTTQEWLVNICGS